MEIIWDSASSVNVSSSPPHLIPSHFIPTATVEVGSHRQVSPRVFTFLCTGETNDVHSPYLKKPLG